MKKIVIRMMKAAGYEFVKEDEGRLLFYDVDAEANLQLIINRKMFERTIEFISNRAYNRGIATGEYRIKKIISDYQNLGL